MSWTGSWETCRSRQVPQSETPSRDACRFPRSFWPKRMRSRRGSADGAWGWIPSVATMPASPTRTATPGPCRNAVIARNERNTIMGLSWQQGPLSSVSVGRFLTPEPLPQRLLFAEPLRRRLRVKLADEWIADSEDVLLLHEPGRYPVAFFPLADVRPGVLVGENRTTQHRDFGDTEWFTVNVGERSAVRGAWQYTALPDYASELRGRVAFAWRTMDAFYEEDDRIVGHASDPYHRIDIRQSSRHLVVIDGVKPIADTKRPVVLFESGFAPRWYVPRQDIDENALIPAEGQTFCPYKGLASYYDIGDH